MIYIYDVLLNFTDENKLIDFFEWNSNDNLEHIKRIPLIKISSKQLKDFIQNNIVVDKELLDKIKQSTISYNPTKDLEYAVLLSDGSKVIAFEFNKRGEVISKSSLLLDEEEEIIEESCEEKAKIISYKILNQLPKETFLTRKEKKHQKYLLKEIENLYKANNLDKLTFLYEEVYSKDNLSLSEKYLKLKKDLEINYTSQFNQLYETVRLTYIKK